MPDVCAYPPCEKRLKHSSSDRPRWCSIAHRDATLYDPDTQYRVIIDREEPDA